MRWVEMRFWVVSELDPWEGWDIMTDSEEQQLRNHDWSIHEAPDVPPEEGATICLDCGVHPDACSCSVPFPPHWRGIFPIS